MYLFFLSYRPTMQVVILYYTKRIDVIFAVTIEYLRFIIVLQKLFNFYNWMNIADFLCGLVAGWTQVLVGQPFDFVKVKVQTATKGTLSITKIINDIYQQYGLKGFYRGSSSLLFGFAFTIGTQFLVYEWAKRCLYSYWNNRLKEYNPAKLSLWQVSLAGGFAGAAVSFIYCPVQYTKIQRQLGMTNQSSLTLFFKELAANGIKNIYRGFWLTMLREVYGSVCYYGTYEAMVRLETKDNRQLGNTWVFLKAGATAGISFHLFTYPVDTLKTNIQSGMPWKEGIQNSFMLSKLAGYKVVLVRAALVNACSFLAYQKLQQYVKFFSNYTYAMW